MSAPPSPLFRWTETVPPAWIDYNGHMNVAYYVMIVDHATEAFHAAVGIDEAYRRAGASTFAVEQHVNYLREVHAGATIACATRLVGLDDKRLMLFHELFNEGEGYLAATSEVLALHVDLGARRASPFPPAVRARLAEVLAAHAAVPLAAKIGRSIAVPGG
jgi:acyl-CoA thioester hydrolase